MPANYKKVSVGWQIVFTFIAGLNFWAFYRIGKLQRYLLYVVAPSLAASLVLLAFINNRLNLFAGESYYYDFVILNPVEQALGFVGFGLQALAIYLVIIWSREHNRMFEKAAST
ncbi:MAG: hypothetical protein ABI347_06920 [Nitrososphaera sp.]